MYNDHKQSGHISTNIQAEKYIYPSFWPESQYYLQINAWFQICTIIIHSQDTYQQIYKQKIYIPQFLTWVTLLSTDQRLISNMYNDHKHSGYLSTNLQAKNAWFQIHTMIINSQDTYQKIYKPKKYIYPSFRLDNLPSTD